MTNYNKTVCKNDQTLVGEWSQLEFCCAILYYFYHRKYYVNFYDFFFQFITVSELKIQFTFIDTNVKCMYGILSV